MKEEAWNQQKSRNNEAAAKYSNMEEWVQL
jgi:hypothetical protein